MKERTVSDNFVMAEQGMINVGGAWVIGNADKIDQAFGAIPIDKFAASLKVDGSNITYIDSAGAWVLQKWLAQWQSLNKKVELINFNEERLALIKLVQQEASEISMPPKIKSPGWFWTIGKLSAEKCRHFIGYLNFIGELCSYAVKAILVPRWFQIPAIASTINSSGVNALPIIALLSFLIGVVLVYQSGIQLRDYGANVYVVNLSGIAILREFAPLITAIIIAGRTSSSFTAQIGLMQVNEEIDALKTMGISPMQRLVLPRVIGLIIVLPLLVFWSDVFGMLGSMLMSKSMFDISFLDFLNRFRTVVSINNYYIGLGKAPIFAIIIATVGCYRGLLVTGSAESVGQQTTASVVQAIFLIIVADAGFSVLFSWADI